MDPAEESCENCRHLLPDDTCGNAQSVYHGRPMVYRNRDDVLQAGWCEQYARSMDHTRVSDG